MNLNENTKLHPRITECIEIMLLNSRINLPYYGEFNLHINYIEKKNDPQIKTAGVNVTKKGMNHYYNPDFIDSLTQEQVNFLVLHETFHLLMSHPRRTRMGGYDPQLSNIAQDMIINTLLVQDISSDFIDIPKNEKGQNSALFIPKDYTGEWVFEILYNDLKKKKEEFDKNKAKKEDNKIFEELFSLKNRPATKEIPTNPNTYQGQYLDFLSILTKESKEDTQSYMLNFVRKVLNNLNQPVPLPVKLIGHTSSKIPDGESDDYNQLLSERRALMFKNAVIEQIDSYMDTYAYCLSIMEQERDILSQKEKIEFILKYEEITNDTIKKQREKELNDINKKSNGKGDNISMLFEQYRFAELDKLDESTLKSIVSKKGLNVPNIQKQKLHFISLAQTKLEAIGKSDTEKIIINEDDEEPSILRQDLVSIDKYSPLKFITDSETKQNINRRLTYEFDDSNDNGGESGGSSPEKGEAEGGYGKNGINGEECFDINGIFEQMEGNGGEFMDNHIQDDIPEELREQMIKDVQEKLRARGLETGNITQTLGKLQKKRKDYLKEIKRGISQIKGHIKDRTISRPNRRGIVGLKGNKKIGSKINCLLDTSGSMGGYFDKALSFIFRSDIEINLIMVDTKVQSVENVTSMKKLKEVQIRGLGGTTIQPAVEYIVENFNNLNTIILTDGYTDSLDFSKHKGKVLIISNGVKCPIDSGRQIKQIVIEDFND